VCTQRAAGTRLNQNHPSRAPLFQQQQQQLSRSSAASRQFTHPGPAATPLATPASLRWRGCVLIRPRSSDSTPPHDQAAPTNDLSRYAAEIMGPALRRATGLLSLPRGVMWAKGPASSRAVLPCSRKKSSQPTTCRALPPHRWHRWGARQALLLTHTQQRVHLNGDTPGAGCLPAPARTHVCSVAGTPAAATAAAI
jgi:hypothetical protein